MIVPEWTLEIVMDVYKMGRADAIARLKIQRESSQYISISDCTQSVCILNN